MIDKLWYNEETLPSKEDTTNKELLHALHSNVKNFSRELEFVDLDYNTRREKVDDMVDELMNILYKENLAGWNAFMTVLMEMIKNSADHSDSNTEIQLHMTRNTWEKQTSIHFSVYDNWPGLSRDDEEINPAFATYEWHKDRKKKWKKNFWLWLNLIYEGAKMLNIDLILHNKWNIIHLHDFGLQKNAKTQEKFWHEWFWIFDSN